MKFINNINMFTVYSFFLLSCVANMHDMPKDKIVKNKGQWVVLYDSKLKLHYDQFKKGKVDYEIVFCKNNNKIMQDLNKVTELFGNHSGCFKDIGYTNHISCTWDLFLDLKEEHQHIFPCKLTVTHHPRCEGWMLSKLKCQVLN